MMHPGNPLVKLNKDEMTYFQKINKYITNHE